MSGSPETDPKQVQEEPHHDEAVEGWEGRPKIREYPNGKYRVGDRVFVSDGRALLGPYLISSVASLQKYVLCTEDATHAEVEGGRIYDEIVLASAT